MTKDEFKVRLLEEFPWISSQYTLESNYWAAMEELAARQFRRAYKRENPPNVPQSTWEEITNHEHTTHHQ